MTLNISASNSAQDNHYKSIKEDESKCTVHSNSSVNVQAHKNASWGTKKLVLLALFTALCTLLGFIEIPIFPAAPWLKYDPSACIALLAAFAFGPISGLVVGGCSAIIHGLIMGDPWGTLMTLVYVICWVLPSALIFKAKTSRLWVIVGLIISAIFALAATIGANLLVTPLYAGMTIDAVAALVVPVLIPFNLLKILINSILLFALYNPVLKLTQR